MKKVHNTISNMLCLSIIMLLTGSCKKYLSPAPISSFSTGIAFSNLTNAKAALMGAYLALAGDYGYGAYTSYQYSYDDDALLTGGNAGSARYQAAHYTLTSSNVDIFNTYNQFYAGIERANNCIYYLPLMNGYNSNAELQRMYGEALVLRAQFYYELVRIFGDLPEQRVPTAFIPDPYLGRTNRDSIYSHIIADLDLAKAVLPWRTQVAPDERFTKGAAMALRAKIALTRGGYSLRQNAQISRPADYLDFYKIARTECDTLMQHRDQHNLLPSYKSLWKDVIDAHKVTDQSGELIMQVAMANGTNSDSRLGILIGTRMNGVGSPFEVILPTYFYQFDSTDVRRDVTIVPFEIAFDVYGRGHASQSMYTGKFRKDWVSNPSYYFSAGPASAPTLTATPASNTGLQTMQINWPLIRFSDVLLMFAEADNEINGAPTTDAINAFKEVSLRGHGGNAALLPIVPTDKDGFFKLLVRERSLEFGGEGVRKYDLLRWNLLGTALSETSANLVKFVAGTAMVPYSYMASPPAYTLTNTLPRFMYFYWQKNAIDNNNIWANSFYKASPASGSHIADNTVTPANPDITVPNNGGNLNRVPWFANSSVNSIIISRYAIGFTPNKSELYPLPQSAKDANYNLVPQNPNY